jgi:hypothetical protein
MACSDLIGLPQYINRMSEIKKGENIANGQLDDRGHTWSVRSKSDFVKGSQRKLGMYNDPTYLGFMFLFQPNSPLLDTSGAPGSAYYYLNKIGETKRAEYIKMLAEIIRDLNHNMPWYWQSIEGLENAYKWGNMKDPYHGGDDSQITINTLESIDLKITQIIELYRNAVYDFKHRREIVPENLRKFKLWVWVQEMRKFQIDQSLEKPVESFSVLDITKASEDSHVNNKTPWILFELDYCEFMTDNSNPYLSSLSFTDPAAASNKVLIIFENISYVNGNYGQLSQKLKDYDITSTKTQTLDVNNLGKNLKGLIDSSANNISQQINNVGEDIVNNFVTSLFLGNVHGVSPSSALDTINQASISNIVGELGNVNG